MSALLSAAVFFTTWWVVLFAVLPWGVRSPDEAGETGRPAGADPGAPPRPMMLKKVVWTTIVAVVVFAAIDAYVFYVG